ncbi:MAG: hypothetical protein ABGX20_11485 [Bacillus sp. (in: firmicutes)]
MKELFFSWFKEHKEELLKRGIKTDLILEPTMTDNSAIYADHISSGRMGRVTVWNSGLIDMEILDQNSGETIFYTHLEIRETNPQINCVLKEYFDRLVL